MPRQHIVRQGECLHSIAAASGLGSSRALYEHERNAELRRRRGDHGVLSPGDVVYVPDPPAAESFDVSPGSSYRFQAPLPKVRVRLRLDDDDEQPHAGVHYRLRFHGRTIDGTTDGDGYLDELVPATLAEVHAWIWIEQAGAEARDEARARTLVLRLGHLDPVEDLTGVQARLGSLGYDCALSGVYDDRTRAAVRAFQEDAALTPTGALDDDTRGALTEVHGAG